MIDPTSQSIVADLWDAPFSEQSPSELRKMTPEQAREFRNYLARVSALAHHGTLVEIEEPPRVRSGREILGE